VPVQHKDFVQHFLTSTIGSDILSAVQIRKWPKSSIDHLVNGRESILFGGVGQMSVVCRSGGAAVTEECLDMTKA